LIAHEKAAMAAKRYIAASRAALDRLLRPFGLGGTQWWVLQQLQARLTVPQRELPGAMHVERATASEIVLTLVRKGLVEQVPDPADQRQKLLRLTDDGVRICQALPDPMLELYSLAFDGLPTAELEAVARVLEAATQRLESAQRQGEMS
jgi:MarR family transcriptional regulator, lower aerobic nicotinate degradation pathway regulator